jgi:hypothetical protein
MIRFVMVLAICLCTVPLRADPHPVDPHCLLDMAFISEAGCCWDGIDQDRDGLTDHQDPDCQGNP